MEKHDLRVKAAKDERMKAAAPDDDGWITVTSRGNRRKVPLTTNTLGHVR